MLLVKGAFCFPQVGVSGHEAILGLVWTAEANAYLAGLPSWETP